MKGKNKMQKLDIQVKGQPRRVYLEKTLGPNSWRARVYVGSKIVSGTLKEYSNGSRRFYPMGKNAGLL